MLTAPVTFDPNVVFIVCGDTLVWLSEMETFATWTGFEISLSGRNAIALIDAEVWASAEES